MRVTALPRSTERDLMRHVRAFQVITDEEKAAKSIIEKMNEGWSHYYAAGLLRIKAADMLKLAKKHPQLQAKINEYIQSRAWKPIEGVKTDVVIPLKKPWRAPVKKKVEPQNEKALPKEEPDSLLLFVGNQKLFAAHEPRN